MAQKKINKKKKPRQARPSPESVFIKSFAEPFRRLIRENNLPPSLGFYLVILSLRIDVNNVCDPSMAIIAGDSHTSVRAAQMAIGKLVKMGIVKRSPRPGKSPIYILPDAFKYGNGSVTASAEKNVEPAAPNFGSYEKPGGESIFTPGGESIFTPGGESIFTPGGESIFTPGGESIFTQSRSKASRSTEGDPIRSTAVSDSQSKEKIQKQQSWDPRTENEHGLKIAGCNAQLVAQIMATYDVTEITNVLNKYHELRSVGKTPDNPPGWIRSVLKKTSKRDLLPLDKVMNSLSARLSRKMSTDAQSAPRAERYPQITHWKPTQKGGDQGDPGRTGQDAGDD